MVNLTLFIYIDNCAYPNIRDMEHLVIDTNGKTALI